MTNYYHYIIASLPDLTLNFEHSNFNIESLKEPIDPLLSPSDRRALEFLLFGLSPQKLTNHFYRAAKNHKSRFIREYFQFDLELRNIQAAYLSKKNGFNRTEWLVGSNPLTEYLENAKGEDLGLSSFSERGAEIIEALKSRDMLEREYSLEKLRWREAEEIVIFNYFELEVILAFFLKASIVERWAKLGSKEGERIFKELVEKLKSSYTI
ncbi:MAG: DUF2764 family protein [Bacteroidales bacterium]